MELGETRRMITHVLIKPFDFMADWFLKIIA